ncbi:MAG: glycosyltransferase [Paludibacter sp.]|nr:glycosyltransferase [Paludibacter sp.]
MKILIVCSENSGQVSPFVLEQVSSLQWLGIEFEYFLIDRKGILGYLRKRKTLLKKIKIFQPDIIHAHYGLSGLLANLQRGIPVVTTYLGSDINYQKVLVFSRIAMILSAHNIFVSERNRLKSGFNNKQSLIPFGVMTDLFIPNNKRLAREELDMDQDKKFVLFAGAFENPVKNPELAHKAIGLLENVELLKTGGGFSREQIALLMNAVDVALMTSFTEGSPQFIKEAMACNCAIVSVPVGDVPEMIQGTEGCFIATYDPADVAEKLRMALEYGKRTEGRKRILELKLDSDSIARRILAVYQAILKEKGR